MIGKNGLVRNLTLYELRLAVHMTLDCEVVRLLDVTRVRTNDRTPAVDVHLFEITGYDGTDRCFSWQEPVSETEVRAAVVPYSRQTTTAAQALMHATGP